MMKLRLNNLPIPLLNINKKFDMENIKKIYELEKNIFNKNDENSIIMYLNIKNNNKEILNVTTNDAIFKNYNNDIINSKELYKRPVLLCQLRHGEELILTCKSMMNISLNDYKYAAIKSPCMYKEIKESEYEMKIESRR
jgi:hypothetical protein